MMDTLLRIDERMVERDATIRSYAAIFASLLLSYRDATIFRHYARGWHCSCHAISRQEAGSGYAVAILLQVVRRDLAIWRYVDYMLRRYAARHRLFRKCAWCKIFTPPLRFRAMLSSIDYIDFISRAVADMRRRQALLALASRRLRHHALSRHTVIAVCVWQDISLHLRCLPLTHLPPSPLLLTISLHHLPVMSMPHIQNILLFPF